MFVAGGYGTNSIAYSYDAVTWTGAAPSLFVDATNAIGYGDGKWVAGAGVPNLAYSYDGINWLPSSSSVFSYCVGVAYHNGLWIAGGQGINQLAYSTDGINWYPDVSGNSVITSGCYAITYANGLWLAGGNGTNPLAYSTNGINWTPVQTANIFGGVVYCIAYGGGKWVAGGDGNNHMAYSYDGINWTVSTTGTNLLNYACFGVAYGNGVWVAGGSGQNNVGLIYSYDGINWLPSNGNITLQGNACYAVTYINGVWAAASLSIYTSIYSHDGINWTISPNANTVIPGGMVAMVSAHAHHQPNRYILQNLGPGPWVGGGETSKMIYSADGINWISTTNDVFTTRTNAVAYHAGLWVAGGDGTTTMAYSTDGMNWITDISGSALLETACNTVAYGGGQWVAGGEGTYQLIYSSDGINWTGAGSTFVTRCKTVAYGNGLWLAGGGNGSPAMLYSTDGQIWQTDISGSAPFYAIYAIVYANGTWMVSGDPGGGTVYAASSPDGFNWTVTNLGTIITLQCITIAYANGIWLAGGYGTNQMAYSYDGVTWYANIGGNIFFSGEAYCSSLYYANGIWVAGGAGEYTVIYSYDGLTWSSSYSGNILMPALRAVAAPPPVNVVRVTTTAPNKIITGLTPNTSYSFIVQSDISGALSAPVPFRTVTTCGKPLPVTGLAVSQNVTNKLLTLTFSWTDPVDYATYHVYGLKCTSTSDTIRESLETDLAGSLIIADLDPTLPYTFHIQRGNDAGYSVAASVNTTTTTIYDPRAVSGLQLWLDAKDTAGNGSVVADNTLVTNWQDKSGNGRAVTGSAILKTDSVGRYLNFTSSSYNLASSAWIYGQPYTIFIVDKPTDYTGPYTLIGAQTASTDQFNIRYQSGIILSTNGDNQSLGTAFTALSAPVNVWCFTNYGGKTAYWNKQVSGKAATTDNIVDSLLSIGANNGGVKYSGRMREILIYTGRLPEADREAVSDYLYEKWMPSGFPTVPVENGAVLWLDGQDQRTFYQDALQRSVPGGAVGIWKDKSGADNHMVGPGSHEPYGINMRGCFITGGSVETANVLDAADATLFLVGQVLQGSGIIFSHDSLGRGLTKNGSICWHEGATTNNNRFTDNGNPFIFYGRIKKGQLLSGTFVDASGVQTAYTIESLNMQVAANTIKLGYFINYGEVIYYNRVLTDAEMSANAAYLSAKWAIQIPATDPFSPPGGAQVWLDAASPYSLITSGGTVTAWKDRSGNGNDAVPSGAPAGSVAGVVFTGSQKFKLPDGALPRGAYSTYVVADLSGESTILHGGSKAARLPMWVAVGTGIATSFDGATWNVAANNPFGSLGKAVAFNGSYWVAVGASPDYTISIAKSLDGITWTPSTNSPFYGNFGRGIAWNGFYWVAVGYNSDNTVSIAKSSDGMTWTNANDNPFASSGGTGIAWNGTYWIAVGYNGPRTVCIAKSLNGVDWTNSGNPFAGGFGNGIAWNGSYWVAVGRNSDYSVCIAKSLNGMDWTNSGNPFSGGYGRGIAWNGSYWVAVGNNSDYTVSIAKSSDGMTWTNSTDNPFAGAYGEGIAWNGTYWVAVGYNSSATVCIAKSLNGMDWTASANNPLSGGIGIGVAAGLGPVQNAIMEIKTVTTPKTAMFVAVGQSFGYSSSPYVIVYSMDGINWLPAANHDSMGASAIFGVAYANGMWVCAGNGTNVAWYSYDGIIWYPSSSANSIFAETGAVAYGNGVWVLGGYSGGGANDNKLAYSTDGIHWTVSTSGTTALNYNGQSVAYGNGVFVAGGRYSSTNSMVYSTDGIIWTPSASGSALITYGVNAITYANGLWMACDADTVHIVYSNDGIHWEQRGNAGSVFGQVYHAPAYGNGLWVTSSSPAYSTNGTTWTAINDPVLTSAAAVAYAAGIWVFSNGTNYSYNDVLSGFAYSTDGIHWTANPASAIMGNASQIATNITSYGQAAVTSFDTGYFDPPSLWVASGGGINQLAYSIDGINWTASTSGNSVFTSYTSKVAYGNFWVAVGVSSGTNIMGYSYDAINWTASTSGNAIFTSNIIGLAYGNGVWVATGEGTNQLAYSTDGINWTASTSGNSVITNVCFNVAYANGVWVAVGYGANMIATSSDGINWTGRGNPFTYYARAIAYGNGRWVAGGFGDNGMYYSDNNGENWNQINSSPFPAPSSQCLGVAYGNGRWVAGGFGANRVVFSDDGTNWSGSGSGNSILSGLSDTFYYLNNLWVAGGDGANRMAYSTDGANWTASTSANAVFTSVCSAVVGIPTPHTFIPITSSLTDSTVVPLNKPIIVESLYDTGKSLYLSGLTGPTDTSTHLQDASNNYIGWDLSGNYMHGTIKEVLIYGVKHSTAQRQQVERYLKAKWFQSAYRPSDASGALGLWLDSDPDTFDYTGTGIRIWYDKSGHTNASQTQLWAQPIYSLDPVTNKYGVQFGSDGIATGFTTTPFTNTSDFSIFVVQRTDFSSDISGDTVNGLTNTVYDASGFRLGTGIATGTAELVFNGPNYSTVDPHQPVLTSQIVTGGAAAEYVNGASGALRPGWVAGGVTSAGVPTIAISYDGTNWTVENNTGFYDGGGGYSGAVIDIVWNGSYWVAVGLSSNRSISISKSFDGVNWATSTNNPFSGGGLNRVAWNGSYWVAVGNNGSYSIDIAISFDGMNWTPANNNPFGGAQATAIAWNGSYWIATGNAGGSYTTIKSYDGLNWTITATTPFPGGVGYAISWNGSYWLAGGNSPVTGSTIAISADGENWTPTLSLGGNDPFNNQQCFHAAWNGSYWVAVGATSYFNVSIAKSYDAINWTQYNTFPGGGASGVAWNGSYWVVAGNNGVGSTIVVSADGENWTPQVNNPFTGTGGAALGVGYGLIPATTTSLPPVRTSTPLSIGYTTAAVAPRWLALGTTGIASSTDGIVWTAGTNPFIGGIGYGAAWNGSYWVAVGTNGDSSVCIVKSSDGVNWTPSTDNPFAGGAGFGIAWNGSYWVAVGYNGSNSVTIARSTDGLHWTPSSNAFSNTYGAGRKIAWNGSYWVAAGQDGNINVSIVTSTDGITWTPSTNSPLPGGAYGIGWNGSYWVAVGYNQYSTVCIATSTDGMTWTNATNNPFDGGIGQGIAWNGSYWVAVGKNGPQTVCIAKSTDGMTWTASTNNPFSLSDYAGAAVAWNGSYWVAVGANGDNTISIATSHDGMNWGVSANNPFAGGPAYGIAYGGFVPGTGIIPSIKGAMRGYIYELVAYNSALSTADREAVEGYLAWKWGVALPRAHPYFLTPP